MTKLKEVYKCSVCSNIVEMIHSGVGELVCCGKPMQLQTEKQKDVGNEKHVPVIEKTSNGYKIKIGSTPHPMEPEHYIEWIKLITNGTIYRKHLKPGDMPEADFCIKASSVTAREFCNKHGLWTT